MRRSAQVDGPLPRRLQGPIYRRWLSPATWPPSVSQASSGPSYDDAGRSSRNPANHDELTNVRGYETFRQVADAGSFEGQTRIGLGVRAHLRFRVFSLTGRGSISHVVVDVAHRW
jgi:hypothetical protein